MPAEVLWPTVAIGAITLLAFGGVALLRLLPRPGSRAPDQPDREVLEELRLRLDQLEQLQERMSELEERVDFTERLLAKQREPGRLPAAGLGGD